MICKIIYILMVKTPLCFSFITIGDLQKHRININEGIDNLKYCIYDELYDDDTILKLFQSVYISYISLLNYKDIILNSILYKIEIRYKNVVDEIFESLEKQFFELEEIFNQKFEVVEIKQPQIRKE